MNIEFVGAAELYDKYNTPAETIVNLPLAEVPIALGKKQKLCWTRVTQRLLSFYCFRR